MTRKDYILIAQGFKDAREGYHPSSSDDMNMGIEIGIETAARLTALRLLRDNPRFDRERFLKACGVTP